MVHSAIEDNIIGSAEVILQYVGHAKAHRDLRGTRPVARSLDCLIHEVDRRDLKAAPRQLDGICPRTATDFQHGFARQFPRVQDA